MASELFETARDSSTKNTRQRRVFTYLSELDWGTGTRTPICRSKVCCAAVAPSPSVTSDFSTGRRFAQTVVGLAGWKATLELGVRFFANIALELILELLVEICLAVTLNQAGGVRLVVHSDLVHVDINVHQREGEHEAEIWLDRMHGYALVEGELVERAAFVVVEEPALLFGSPFGADRCADVGRTRVVPGVEIERFDEEGVDLVAMLHDAASIVDRDKATFVTARLRAIIVAAIDEARLVKEFGAEPIPADDDRFGRFSWIHGSGF